MEIIPALDLSNGRCVRLYKGVQGTEKIYSEDPLEILNIWVKNQAKRLHIIDLDRAWGKGSNENIIRILLNESKDRLKIQVGGGIRTVKQAKNYFEFGADRIILGTLAIRESKKIRTLSQEFGNEHIMVALDYKLDKILIDGWKKETNINPFSLVGKIIEQGAGYILFSSIEADGTLNGPDFDNINKLSQYIDPRKIYAAGGIRNTQDIKDLKKLGIKGVIIGKAFYENKIPLSIVKESN